jgi:hypothetical protein
MMETEKSIRHPTFLRPWPGEHHMCVNVDDKTHHFLQHSKLAATTSRMACVSQVATTSILPKHTSHVLYDTKADIVPTLLTNRESAAPPPEHIR